MRLRRLLKPLQWFETLLRQDSWRTYLLLFLLAFLYYASVSWRFPFTPTVHDEFAHLLTADTFAHGRLTNPVHPLARFFEAPHILVQPTYISKYPIGLPLLQALGLVLFGTAQFGAIFSTALGSVAVFWAIRPLLPLRWAVLGWIMVVFDPLIVWCSWSSMGGGLAVLGGSLVFGAIYRLAKGLKNPDWGALSSGRVLLNYGAGVGLGLGILLLSRPYEGIAITLCSILVWLAPQLAKPGVFVRLLRVAGVALVLLLPVLALILIENRAVTGSPFLLPYLAYTKQYDPIPAFIWQKSTGPFVYHNLIMVKHYQIQREMWDPVVKGGAATLLKWSFFSRDRVFPAAKFLLSWPFHRPLFLVAALGSAFWWKRARKEFRQTTVTLVAFFGLVLLAVYASERYTFPGIALMAIVMIGGIRAAVIGLARRMPKPNRIVFSGLVQFLLLILFAQNAVTASFHVDSHNHYPPGGLLHRRTLLSTLKAQGGKHLIIVRYTEKHPASDEWAYNGADIDGSPIIWAHDMGAEENQALLRYYPDRTVHLLTLGDPSENIKLEPYPK